MAWEHTVTEVGLQAAETLEVELAQQDKKGAAALLAAVRTIAEMYPDKPIYITTYGHLDEHGGFGTLNFTIGNRRDGSAMVKKPEE